MKTLIEIAKNGKQMAKMAERGKKWPKWQKEAKNGQNGKKYSNSKQNQLTFHMVRFSFGII